MLAPFVGRERELEAVDAVASVSSRASSPAALVVIGDPGSGKTRLLDEAWARSGISRRLAVVGYEPERRVPLAAARGLLAQLASESHEGRRFASLVYGSRASELAPLQVFEGAHRALSELGPVMLTIDDVQWIDDLTIALCHYLVRAARGAGHPFVVVVASRPGQSASKFADALRAVVRSAELYRRVELGPLDLSSGMQLAQGLDPALDESSAARLWDKAAGLPFWLELLANARGEEREVDALVVSRISGLGSDASTILATLSIAGRPLTPSVVAGLLRWPEARVDPAVRELADRGLAAVGGPALVVAHDLLRAAAIKEMPDQIVKEIHSVVADWLEAQAEDDVQLLREALDHRVAAGVPATLLALRLVRSKRRRLLTADDLRELTAIADDEEANGGDPTELLWQIAEAATAVGQPALTLERWSDLVTRLPKSIRSARAALNAAQAEYELEDSEKAAEYLERCRAAASTDPLLAIEMDALKAQIAGNSTQDSYIPMRRAVDAAKKMAHAAGGVRELSSEARHAYRAALQANLYFCLRAELPHDMLVVSEYMADAAFDSAESRLTSTLDSVLALRILGRYEEAEKRCRSAWLEARRLVLPAVAFHSAHMLATTLHRLGRLEEAKAAAKEAVEFLERSTAVIPPWLSSTWIRSLPYELEASTGDWRNAVAAIIEHADEEKDPHFRLNIRLEAAWWLARLGDSGARVDVAAQIESGDADAEAAACARCASEFAVRSAQAHCRVGLTREAKQTLATWDERHPNPEGQVAFFRRHAGALVTATDEPADGAALLDRVIGEAVAMGARLEETWARLDLGSVLSNIDRDGAVATLRQAADLARSIGARNEAHKAEQGLRALGVRTWRRSKSGATSTQLTEREVEIARLVAGGMSNPEVAEAVFLSRKTIERHVSNIMTKLGVRNRTELASKLAIAGAPRRG